MIEIQTIEGGQEDVLQQECQHKTNFNRYFLLVIIGCDKYDNAWMTFEKKIHTLNILPKVSYMCLWHWRVMNYFVLLLKRVNLGALKSL